MAGKKLVYPRIKHWHVSCNLVLLFFVNVIMTACYTAKPLYIEVMEPAEINYIAPIKSIILDKNWIENPSIDTLAVSWLEGFKSSLKENIRVDSFFYLSTPMDTGSLSSRSDFKIFIKDIGYKEKIRSEQLFLDDVILYENDGENLREPRVVVHLIIDYYIHWGIFDIWKNRVIHENLDADRITLNEISFNEDTALAKLPSSGSILNSLFYEYGSIASSLFFPGWRQEKRLFFSCNKKDWLLAEYYSGVQQWIDAAELWSKYTYSSSRKEVKYSSYNMALANEMEGNLEAAVYWIERSAKHGLNFRAREYTKSLKFRLTEQQILQQQFGE